MILQVVGKWDNFLPKLLPMNWVWPLYLYTQVVGDRWDSEVKRSFPKTYVHFMNGILDSIYICELYTEYFFNYPPWNSHSPWKHKPLEKEIPIGNQPFLGALWRVHFQQSGIHWSGEPWFADVCVFLVSCHGRSNNNNNNNNNKHKRKQTNKKTIIQQHQSYNNKKINQYFCLPKDSILVLQLMEDESGKLVLYLQGFHMILVGL